MPSEQLEPVSHLAYANRPANQAALQTGRDYLGAWEKAHNTHLSNDHFDSLSRTIASAIVAERASEVLLAKSACGSLAQNYSRSNKDTEVIDRVEAMLHERARGLVEELARSRT